MQAAVCLQLALEQRPAAKQNMLCKAPQYCTRCFQHRLSHMLMPIPASHHPFPINFPSTMLGIEGAISLSSTGTTSFLQDDIERHNSQEHPITLHWTQVMQAVIPKSSPRSCPRKAQAQHPKHAFKGKSDGQSHACTPVLPGNAKRSARMAAAVLAATAVTYVDASAALSASRKGATLDRCLRAFLTLQNQHDACMLCTCKMT